jgi:hypothetical protein
VASHLAFDLNSGLRQHIKESAFARVLLEQIRHNTLGAPFRGQTEEYKDLGEHGDSNQMRRMENEEKSTNPLPRGGSNEEQTRKNVDNIDGAREREMILNARHEQSSW